MAAEGEAGLKQCGTGHPLSVGGSAAALARGFNLPNWDPRYTGLKPDDMLLSLLRDEGFSHIRLPVDAEQLIGDFTARADIKAFLDRLDEEVTRLTGLGFAVSIDMHPAGRFQSLHGSLPDIALKDLTSAWDLVAERATNWPGTGIYFELLNEPVPSQEIWWRQAQTLSPTSTRSRQVVGWWSAPAVFQRYEPLLAAQPLDGENIIYAIHYYDPFIFTHQAMTWEQGSYFEQLGQLPFPGDISHPAVIEQIAKMERFGEREAVENLRQTYAEPWNADRLAKDFAAVGAWARRHKTVVIVNEFGVLNFDVDQWSRIDWLRAVRKGAEKACLGWAHWDFSDGFAMVDPTTTIPDPFVLDALLSPSR